MKAGDVMRRRATGEYSTITAVYDGRYYVDGVWWDAAIMLEVYEPVDFGWRPEPAPPEGRP